MLNIRTPLHQCVREIRKVNLAGFYVLPGVWIKVNNDGSVSNVTTGVAPAVAKLCIDTYTGNTYEGNDIKSNDVTVLATIGSRFDVDSVGFDIRSVVVSGSYLTVSSSAGYEGKLKLAVGGETAVAVVEEYDSVNHILTFMIIDPITMAATTTTAAPVTTTTAAPVTTTTAAPVTTTTAAPVTTTTSEPI